MKELLEMFLKGLGLFTEYENHSEPEQEVREDEKVVGEMNDLEKGCFTVISEKKKEREKIIEEGMVALCFDEEEEKEKEKQMQELKCRVQKIDKTSDVARSIMWASIEERFPASKESTGIGVRKGFKVVEMLDHENDDFMPGMIMPGMGMMIIGMGRRGF